MWHNGNLVPHDLAVSQGLISSALYGYIGGTYVLEFNLQPWRGFWVRAFQNVTLRIHPVEDRANRATVIPSKVTRASAAGGNGWSVNLRLSSGGLADEATVIGTSDRLPTDSTLSRRRSLRCSTRTNVLDREP